VKIIYVDMDDVLCDYTNGLKQEKQNHPNEPFPQSRPGFFRRLRPIKGAISAIENLLKASNMELYILTAPSTRNPLSYTEKRLWIEDYFGYELTKRLIICSNKGLLKGDCLIDDHVEGRGRKRLKEL